ncbi:MAG: DUF4275 family protein [Clostridia bacterium]|nr:DUF4275 family protein [Clostridia bacterium]
MDKKEFKAAVKRLRAVAKNNSNFKKNPFFARWLKEFIPELTDAQYRRCIRKRYIWHAFYYNIIPDGEYLEGDEARKAFDRADKEGALSLQFDFEDTPVALTEEFDTAEKVEDYFEFYVVGKDFSWTYIVTHETDIGIGPYFMENKK